MRIHIINYEQGIKSGILTKFCDRLVNGLICRDIDVTISNIPNDKADINHHVNYEMFRSCNTKNTAMVTHIDTHKKLQKMKSVTKEAVGICMSKETKQYLISQGIEEKKLSVVLPASDIKRRPRIIAILTQTYPDGRKREGMLLELLDRFKDRKEEFAFNIVGEGWEDIVKKIKEDGFMVIHIPRYTHEVGQGVLNGADFLLYLGKDEGAMSVLDATMAGVRTIAPNIGFHQSIGIDYPFDTIDDLEKVFESILENKVSGWTWDNYVNEHIKIWEKL